MYGRGYGAGYGRGYGAGYGRGYAGNPSPYCRFNPALPRRWWMDPELRERVETGEIPFYPPVAQAYTGVDKGFIDTQVKVIEQQIEDLHKELEYLKARKEDSSSSKKEE